MDTLIKEKARTICAVIKATNTDDRGILFIEIADQLTLDAQGFTAELFRIIGTRYGFVSSESKRQDGETKKVPGGGE